MLTALLRGTAIVLCLAIISCGGDNVATVAGPPITVAQNVATVTVGGGPVAGTGSVNTLYTSVTVCSPGSTTNCQIVDHVQVDTGSYGLRVLAPILTAALPTQPAADGNSLMECTQFVDGYSWGSIAAADVTIAGETAASVPVQIIGDNRFPVPADCSGTGAAENTVAQFGANGILGVGVFKQDCGVACADPAKVLTGHYYSCTATACVAAAASLATQVQNPVPLFAADNNGVIVDLPGVAAPGAAGLTGNLIFGIDTQANNQSAGEQVLTVDVGSGNFTTIFNGQTLVDSFLDTGSNGLFFSDPGLAACSGTSFSGFYCPPAPQNFTATLQGVNMVSRSVDFTVDNIQTIETADPTLSAVPTLAGTFTAGTTTFDWGLPFFYGRRVLTAIENATSSAGTGPYVAF